MKPILMWFVRILLRTAMDRGLRMAIEKAVYSAEHSSLAGEAKMKNALYQIKQSGVKALINETESSLRTKVELIIDDLGI